MAKIKYALYPNHLTAKKGDYMAFVQGSQSYTFEDIADQVLVVGGAVSKPSLLSSKAAEDDAMIKIIENGGSINTDMFNISIDIGGAFDSEEETFNPAKHQFKLSITPGKRLRKVLENLTAEKVDAKDASP
jgi:hypothetical protein